MKKTLILTVSTLTLIGATSPALAGDCCSGAPASRSLFNLISGETPEAEETQAPEQIAPASGAETQPAATPENQEPEAAADAEAAPNGQTTTEDEQPQEQ
ncbi:MAG: hypothetical protein WBK77_03345 [Alphaproteobacteria bacterium]